MKRAHTPVLAAFLAAVILGAQGPAVTADEAIDEDRLGWSACGWPDGHTITVGLSTEHPFPGPGFSLRLDEAIGRWDEALEGTGSGVRMARRDAGPDVVFEYRPLRDVRADENAVAETYLQREADSDASPDIGRCPDRQDRTTTMERIEVRIAPRDDWFTGPDDQAGEWQACPDRPAPAADGGCQDTVDFGSTATHELGHTLVLYHPQTIDDLDEKPYKEGDSASRAAACVEATDQLEAQATMCSGQGQWRAEQRTLAPWDIQSARRHYRR